MALLIRVLALALLVLSVVYLSLFFYARSHRRSALEAEWDTSKGLRDEYVAAGLRAYDSGLRKRLVWGVYIVPIAVICLIVYLTNYS